MKQRSYCLALNFDVMGNQSSSADSPWERGFDISYKLACEALGSIKDLEEQCRRSGARYIGPEEVGIDYLNQRYRIRVSDGSVFVENSGEQVSLRDKILILHYFTRAKGTPRTGKLITYKQLPGGISYFSAFFQRTIAPLVAAFGEKPEVLIQSAAKLGGRQSGLGDMSLVVDAFPRVSVNLVIWRGDEEVAPSGSILFDANVSDYLSTEDAAVLTETIVWKLVRGAATH